MYDPLSGDQRYAMVIFFYSTPTIHDCFEKHLKSGQEHHKQRRLFFQTQ